MSASTAPVSDEPLLPKIAAGDERAVREAMDRYGGLVWSLARRFCREQSEAEDAAQDVFISLWKSAHRYDASVASEVTFVAMIARRRLIDRLRARTRTPDAAEITEIDPAARVPDADRLEIGEDAKSAMRAFGQLREEQRRVLQLSIMRGLTHDQIANVTGLPLGTVKTHARRGLIRIRQLLEDEKNATPTGSSQS